MPNASEEPDVGLPSQWQESDAERIEWNLVADLKEPNLPNGNGLPKDLAPSEHAFLAVLKSQEVQLQELRLTIVENLQFLFDKGG